MSMGDTKSQQALGFLTILEHDQLGYVGGYLILNSAGRPLEFHCTAPVKPNRAQQILFGPTLESYLYGEQIGQTLLAKSSVDLLAVCTDVERALCVRDYVATPVALVLAEPAGSEGPSADAVTASGLAASWRVDAAHGAQPHLHEFALGRNRLAVPNHHDDDRQQIAERLTALISFDLAEPFERIREAIEEAHKGSRAA